jgi:hypothetical protein
MWVTLMLIKDETCGYLKSILLETKHLCAEHHASTSAFAPTLKFDSNTMFEAVDTLHMRAEM